MKMQLMLSVLWMQFVLFAFAVPINANTIHVSSMLQSPDNNITSFNNRTSAAVYSVAGDTILGGVNVKDFGATGDGISDDTVAIQEAIDYDPIHIKSIHFPAGYYRITSPLVIPANSGMRLIGESGLKGTHIVAALFGYDSRGAIEYIAGSSPNYAGITIENMHISSQQSRCHGVLIYNTSYILLSNCVIEGFNGAGLLLDKCQDSSFNNLVIQVCGRTRSGGNPTINTDTEYSGLHIQSTIVNDHCNMLRFNDCQFENNNVSPYIWIKDPGCIGLWFNNVHAEVRNSSEWDSYDFMACDGGDIEFYGMALNKFRYGFVFKGYGTTKFNSCRYIGNVKHSQSGTLFKFMMTNVTGGDITWTSTGGASLFTNSVFSNVYIHYPANGPSAFTNCTLGEVHIDHAGAGDPGVSFRGCRMASYTTDAYTSNQSIIDSTITGNMTVGSSSSVVRNNRILGTIAVNSNATFVPQKKELYRSASPTSGSWNVGDIAWNSTPAPGAFIGWIYTQSGWLGFGQISTSP